MNLPAFLQPIMAEYALLSFFLFTLLYSFSLPISEEIALIVVGILANGIGEPLPLVMLVSYPGIFGSDIGYYWLSRCFGGKLLRSRFFAKVFHAKKVEACERYFKERGPRIAFFCRFIVGIRAPTMIAAGILRMPFKLFAFYDGLAAIIWTCLWLCLGYFWGDVLGSGLSTMGRAFAIIAPIALCAVIAIVVKKMRARYRIINESAISESIGIVEIDSMQDKEAM